jgi:hypothetical protein
MNEKQNDQLYNFSQMLFVICLAFLGGWLLAIVKYPIQEYSSNVSKQVSV